MARAKRRDAWDHTANLLALLINVNRDPKRSKAVRAEEIHPLREEPAPLSVEDQNAILKDQFETLKARAFDGKVTYIKPFIPANQDKIDERRRNQSR